MSVLSVVLPAYNEELMIAKTCRVLREVLNEVGIAYELVLVDDGSRDNTWTEIEKAGKKDPHIVGVHFSRNFGKEAAVFAGLAQAGGDVVAVMDWRPAASSPGPSGDVPAVAGRIPGDRGNQKVQRPGKLFS